MKKSELRRMIREEMYLLTERPWSEDTWFGRLTDAIVGITRPYDANCQSDCSCACYGCPEGAPCDHCSGVCGGAGQGPIWPEDDWLHDAPGKKKPGLSGNAMSEAALRLMQKRAGIRGND
jgi:hypothetical protein